jgi:methyl-accepting chemotaxis protein
MQVETEASAVTTLTGAKRAAAPGGLAHRLAILRQRKYYLVDTDTQYQLVRQFVVVLLVGAGLGICNVHVFTSLSALGLTDASLDWAERAVLFGYMLGLLAVSLTLMFLLCLFYSHRVGGPTRKIAESLHLMAAGDLWVNVKLRDSDLLQDVAHSVNLTTSSWRKTVREIEWIAVSLKDRAGDDPLLARHVADLEAIVNRYKTTREG